MIALLADTTPASNAAAAANGSNAVPTDYFVAAATALLLLWAGYGIARRLAADDSYPKLQTVIRASVILHLMCAPLQILVVQHVYKGVADWTRYTHQGALLSDNLRAGQFTLVGTGISAILGNGGASIYGGIIMTIVGPNKLAAFFVAAFLSFVGSVLFYLAFKAVFPEANRGRYALLVFLFPSVLFWTGDVSKESAMILGMGLVAYGMALIMNGRPLGYVYGVVGGTIALVIRSDELVILVVAFAVAMVVRGIFRQGRSFGSPFRVVGAIVVIGAFVALVGTVAAHFVGKTLGSGLGGSLSKVAINNQGVGAGFGSSNVPYSSNPLYYPRDVFAILFDPLPIQAHSVTQLAAAGENVLILLVILFSFRQLRCVFRACLQRPYVLVCVLYSLVFFYGFAALANLGLIDRERVLLLPFMFVILAIPLAPEGEYPYPWQLPRRLRRPIDGARSGPLGRTLDEGSGWEVSDDASAQEWESDSVNETETADWSPIEWTSEL
jgi:hypothetical protein